MSLITCYGDLHFASMAAYLRKARSSEDSTRKARAIFALMLIGIFNAELYTYFITNNYTDINYASEYQSQSSVKSLLSCIDTARDNYAELSETKQRDIQIYYQSGGAFWGDYAIRSGDSFIRCREKLYNTQNKSAPKSVFDLFFTSQNDYFVSKL